MKKTILSLCIFILFFTACRRTESATAEPVQSTAGPDKAIRSTLPVPAANSFKVFDQILFYDGYAATVSAPVPSGVTRVRNDLYARKLSDAQLASLTNSLELKVSVRAACDNYDRIGYVALALVNKGGTYSATSGKHIEIARFITPFMDKNKTPNTVPYVFNINNIAALLRDDDIRAAYDIYVEFMLFGVPYAANTQIAGCSGRNDTFYGTVEFNNKAGGTAVATPVVLQPLYYHKAMDNYTTGNTDQVGQTKLTYNFSLANAVTNAKLYLITSNHGANSGGEEYVRRNHYVYFDNVLKLTYKPGGKSCEPYRQYNTQANGIYGSAPKTTAQWTSWNNWCPGDTIPIRVINLGNVPAGDHSFKIDVPDAVFNGGQGSIPLSVYLQAQ